MKLGFAIAAVLGLCLVGTVFGGEHEAGRDVPRSALEEEIVVTTTRFERDLGSTGASVSVVTEADLRDRQVVGVSRAISIVPGAYTARGGPPGSPSSLFLRGAASNQVLVLLDGIALNDPTLGGQFNFYDLAVDNLESIEVLRGSASTLQGSEAIGGVVNMRTRRGRGEPTGRLRLEGGSYGYLRGVFSTQGRVDDVDFSVSLSRLNLENDLPNNRFGVTTVSGLLGWDIVPGLSVTLSGRYIDSDAQDPWAFPFGEQIETDDNIRRERTTGAGALTIRHDVSDDFTWTLTGSLLDVSSKLEDGPDAAGEPDELVSRSDAQVGTALLAGRWRTGIATETDLALRGGLEYESEQSETRSESLWGAAPDLDRTVRNTAAFLLAEVDWHRRLIVSGGIRRDDNSVWGGWTAGTASALYHHVETGTRFRANYGQGFRGPKPVELADPFVGNPDLTPEASESFDAGLEQHLLDSALVLSLIWFQLETEDLIAWDPGTGRLENFDETRTRGLETQLAWWPVKELLVRTWWTFQDPVNLSAEPGEEDQLPGRPKWFGGVDVSYRGEGWSAGADLIASGDYPDRVRITPDGTERKHPGEKLLIGLRAAFDLAPEVTLSVRIENLLDDDWYDDPTRPSGLGRGLYTGLEFSF